MLLFRSGRSTCWGLLAWLLSVVKSVLITAPQASAQSKGRKKKGLTPATPSGSPSEQNLTNIPLPIGHEAKGLELPDFDANGRLRGKFDAGRADRTAQEQGRF